MTRYLEQLRLLAANWTNFDNTMKWSMKNSAFVLASRHVASKRMSKGLFSLGGATASEEEYEHEWILCKASEVGCISSACNGRGRGIDIRCL
jgi:hypothetical protein